VIVGDCCVGAGCGGASCAGEGAVGGGGAAAAGGATTRRRWSTHASHPVEQRMYAQSLRVSITMTSSPGSRFAAGALDPSGAAHAGRPSLGTTWVCA
jgi:hypothetical protein